MLRTLTLFSLPLAVVTLIACGSVNVSSDAGLRCGANSTETESGCVCNSGFTGDGQTCTDIDECVTDNGGCDIDNGICTNTPGSSSCECPPEFAGDGTSCDEIWQLIGTLPKINVSPNGGRLELVGVAGQIFFAPRAPTSQQFMRSFDVSTATFDGPHALPNPDDSNDFEQAGLTPVFLSDGTSIYLMGDDGFRYDLPTDTWTRMASYVEDIRRGEAAGAYVPNSNSLLLIGGRDVHNGDVLEMTIDSEEFTNATFALPTPITSAVAHKAPGVAKIFVAGGNQNGKSLLSGTFASGWTQQTEAPVDLGRPYAMGDFKGRLWVAVSNGDLFFYNTDSDTWSANPLKAPVGFAGAVMVGFDTYVLVQDDFDLQILKLIVAPDLP